MGRDWDSVSLWTESKSHLDEVFGGQSLSGLLCWIVMCSSK